MEVGWVKMLVVEAQHNTAAESSLIPNLRHMSHTKTLFIKNYLNS